ncbi:MAG: tetratricopeptide repeat protein [Chitinophagia bacterium]|nr:tetratricopeptide repeat protein [Chitinophagia bacterium]
MNSRGGTCVISHMPCHLSVRIALASVLIALLSCSDTGRGGGAAEGTDTVESDLSKWRVLLQQDPSNLDLRLRLAEGYSISRRTQDALSTLTDGIRADSGLTVLWNARASVLALAGDTAAGIGDLERSLRLDPGQTSQWLELGFLHAGRGDAEAEAIAGRLLREHPDAETRLQSWYLMGILFGNRGQTAEAIRAFDSCIVIRYSFLDAHIEKGILLQAVRQHREALAAFRMASAIDKSNADAWHWQGASLEALGEREAAAEAYARALALDTTLRAARKGLERTAGRIRDGK